MNKNKIWAVVILVVVVLVVVGIVVVDRKVAKAPEVSGSTAPTGTSVAGQTSSTAPVVQENYTGGSFSLSYPSSWSVSSTRFFSINTFGGKYQNGWMIPMGGAEIDVVTTTVYSSVKEIMTTELMSAANLAKSTVIADGITCDEATYQHSYTPGVVAQNVSVYCLRGSELWKIYFAYRSGDPAAQAHVSDFNGVLGSMKFLP
jgi:hypothetical protein